MKYVVWIAESEDSNNNNNNLVFQFFANDRVSRPILATLN